MALPLARTNAEAHLYMDMHPCSCGATAFPRRSLVVSEEDGLASRYEGPCARCGESREFVFRLPEQVLLPDGQRVRYGGPEPSQLLDAGEWLWVADRYAGAVPAGAERLPPADRNRAATHLASAVAALEEVLKFVPAGQAGVPPEALWNERGREVYDREPGRFGTARLNAVRDTYRSALTRLDPTGPRS